MKLGEGWFEVTSAKKEQSRVNLPCTFSVSVILFITGSIGGILPLDSFSLRFSCYIPTNPSLQIDNMNSTSVRTLRLLEYDDIYTVIEGSDTRGELEIRMSESVRTMLHFPSRNSTVNVYGFFGLFIVPSEPESRINLDRNVLFYRLLMEKEGENVTLFNVSGDLEHIPEEYKVNILDLEDSWNVTPPYTLRCDGWKKYRCSSDIDEIWGDWEGNFWSLDVYENSSLGLKMYTSLPIDTIRGMNPNVRLLKAYWPVLFVLGVLGLIIEYPKVRIEYDYWAKWKLFHK